jgi:transposase InsO family protein
MQTAQTNCILVVVDKFTKYRHFIPLKHPFTVAMVAKVFLENVYQLHGLPAMIISDRDKIFTSNMWKELFALAKVDLSMSTAYHPQSDGQSERVNQCVETYLRCFVSSCPKQWISWLHLAKFWYNTSLHSSIGMSPFEALYGYQPRHFGLDGNFVASGGLSQWLFDRKVVTDLVKQHLNRATVRM